MPKFKTFHQAVDAAVADIRRHGFDSQQRVDYWLEQLRITAQGSLPDPAKIEAKLQRSMRSIYARLIKRREILKRNPGVSVYTLAKVEPRLRAELERRVMASANLIKLNRTQAIQDTLQRFAGWASSVPAGGTKAGAKAGTKDDIRKALGQLPFEERRVSVDQGHKFASSLNDIVATGGGAIAATWHSHWRQAGYDYREDHKERDSNTYLIRDAWAYRQGLVKPGKAGFVDQVTMPGEEIYCRCFYEYVYHLRDLPSFMLTAKGKAQLDAVRVDDIGRSLVTPQSVNYREGEPGSYCLGCTMYVAPRGCNHVAGPISPRGTCDDHVDKALAKAVERDAMGYFEGIREVAYLPDEDVWHSFYEPDDDQIGLQRKFNGLSDRERTRTFLHEIGHRGESIDPGAFAEFKKTHLDTIQNFVDMANERHLAHFKKTGRVDALASEVFAESYARVMLGMPVPEPLGLFWLQRIERQ